jgi:hypothetical protein
MSRIITEGERSVRLRSAYLGGLLLTFQLLVQAGGEANNAYRPDFRTTPPTQQEFEVNGVRVRLYRHEEIRKDNDLKIAWVRFSKKNTWFRLSLSSPTERDISIQTRLTSRSKIGQPIIILTGGFSADKGPCEGEGLSIANYDPGTSAPATWAKGLYKSTGGALVSRGRGDFSIERNEDFLQHYKGDRTISDALQSKPMLVFGGGDDKVSNQGSFNRMAVGVVFSGALRGQG